MVFIVSKNRYESISLWYQIWNGYEIDLYLICIQWKTQINKLGQRQSQTPFSSAFWFLNQNLIKRSCNIICPKRFCAKKDQTNFESIIFLVKKMWVQKELGSKKILGPKNFRSKKIQVQKSWVQINFWTNKFLIQNFFCP